MSITINIYYKGENGSAKNFAMEMIESGIVDAIRNEREWKNCWKIVNVKHFLQVI